MPWQSLVPSVLPALLHTDIHGIQTLEDRINVVVSRAEALVVCDGERGVMDLFTAQGNWRSHVQMEACLPPSAAPAQRLSAAEEARVYQCYTQLCCPSVSTAQGDLVPK